MTNSYSQKIMSKIDINPKRSTFKLIDNKRVHPVILDMDTITPITTNIKFKQFDYGSSTVKVTLMEGSTPVNLQDKAIIGVFRDSDKNILVDKNDELIRSVARAINVNEGTVNVVVPNDILKVAGKIECEIIVFNSDSSRLTSPRFDFYIEPSLYDHDIEIPPDLKAICGDVNCGEVLCGQDIEDTGDSTEIIETSLSDEFINRFGGVI